MRDKANETKMCIQWLVLQKYQWLSLTHMSNNEGNYWRSQWLQLKLIFYVTSSINTQEILALNVYNQTLLSQCNKYHKSAHI